MRVLLLVSAFNGLTQRVWCALREAGHDVGVLLANDDRGIVDGVRAARPELVLCPYLTQRVPAQVWQHWRTVIIHPGPVGDRGPSSLDWAITEAAPVWGVTALQAVDELDAGPIWATRLFPLPTAAPRKSSLYNGPVADAAIECVQEVMAKAANPSFVPTPAEQLRSDVAAVRPRPAMRQADREFDWAQSTDAIVRRIRAADGAPGVRTEVAGLPVFAYDVHPGATRGVAPGTVVSRRQGAVLVGTGDGSVWLGHLRAAEPTPETTGTLPAIKLPATTLLGRRLRGVPHSPVPPGTEPEAPGYRQLRYRRTGAVGWLTFDFYNGAMSTGQCRRLLAALRHAVAQDTCALVLRGGSDAFSNGLDLNLIEAAADPTGTAWANIKAINAVCREIITCTRQVIIAAYTGNAGAGGVMLGLGADVLAGREGIVLNPYYDLGLFGSELHTYTLPRRVGPDNADRLLADRTPVSTARAVHLGLLDEVGPRHPDAFTGWLGELAERYADQRSAQATRAIKARRLASDRVPLDGYEARELAEMSRDIFDDRNGFAAARHRFVTRTAAARTPGRLAFPRRETPPPVRQVAGPRAPMADISHVVRPAAPAPA
ncbi:MAG TPA: enoyl-CoA hydratase-related protein [Pilimelia sp.]|nr:enoyl-CoA hydratase-related protein [Pilimelia sp.]